MLVALREFSLGDRRLTPGDEITFEEQTALPPRRAEQLKHLRLVEERPQFSEDELAERIADLEARLAKLEKPARRKAAA
mgnify:CR=1 FL=1